MIGKCPGVPLLLAWGVVLFVIVLLCVNAESRDYLLGHGKALSVVSVGLLLLVLTMIVVGWSVTSGGFRILYPALNPRLPIFADGGPPGGKTLLTVHRCLSSPHPHPF